MIIGRSGYMKEILKKVLTSKNLVVNNYIISIGIENKLSLNEFLVLVYLDNKFSNVFDLELMSNHLGMDLASTMEAFNSLMMKGFVTLESIKDKSGRLNEIINLDGIYDSIVLSVKEETKEETKVDIFRTFEKELGRTISPMELEMINAWLMTNYSEELILGALKEAVYNGVSNFRYIDKILYEWDKKGFKSMDDVNAHLIKRRDEKKDKVITKKEQDIADYDWLDS